MPREINLVPDIKAEAIKAQKTRNLVIFICVVVASISIIVTVIVGLIVGGQQIALNEKSAKINTLSQTINSYKDANGRNELNDYLTIRDQLGNLQSLSNNHKVFSRTFDILAALLPQGLDTIKISELVVDLEEENPTFTFDAQANAGKEPFIDYNVLDAFKKSMQYMRYDYGHYVDRYGNTIPAYCMIEKTPSGTIFQDQDKGLYALWTIDADGCIPTTDKTTDGYPIEEYEGEKVVRVWRTPQFTEWYKNTKVDDAPYMGLDGSISGVEHFESACVTYTGNVVLEQTSPRWTTSNDNCLLISGGDEGITISDSSNGRDATNNLVLRFSAKILLSPEVYKFPNTHMLAIAPSGRYNVTDSYVQLQSMFEERAKDCKENDAACNASPTAVDNNQDNNQDDETEGNK